MASLLLVTALVATACGDDGSVLGDDSTTTTPATTEAPPTSPPTTTDTLPPNTLPPTTLPPTSTLAPTTTLPPTTTTTAPDVTYEIDEAELFPDPLPGSDQAHGSGCVVPGGSMTLADGIWFGFVTGFSGGTLDFDLACFWTGAVAEAKAAEDGEEAFDFYIRNQNPTIRQVHLDPGARVFYVDTSGPLTMIEITAAEWPHPDSFLLCPDDWCPVWLYVNDGDATGLVEQYLP